MPALMNSVHDPLSPDSHARRALILGGAGLLAARLARADAEPTWTAAWAAAPRGIANGPPAPGHANAALGELTLRQEQALSLGGELLRVRFSNLLGKKDLHIGAATLAHAIGQGDVAPQSLRPILFAGQAAITIAPGAEIWSDPVALSVRAGESVAVSLFLDRQSESVTVHSLFRGMTRVAFGNAVARPNWPSGSALTPWSYLVTGVDVAPRASRSEKAAKTPVIVAFGDSITEGSKPAGQEAQGYPEQLDRRWAGRRVSVLNMGISGNRLLADRVGPSGIDRFARDVLGQSGVTQTVILIGINDISFQAEPGVIAPPAPSAEALAAGLQKLIDQARAQRVAVWLGTLTPFGNASTYNPVTEGKRSRLNEWIRAQQGVRGVRVIDFDKALRDPAKPVVLLRKYNSGDELHPSPEGYAEMARVVADAMDGLIIR